MTSLTHLSYLTTGLDSSFTDIDAQLDRVDVIVQAMTERAAMAVDEEERTSTALLASPGKVDELRQYVRQIREQHTMASEVVGELLDNLQEAMA